MEFLFSNKHTNDPSEFYFKLGKNKRKTFYLVRDNSIVPKKNIDSTIIDKIKEFQFKIDHLKKNEEYIKLKDQLKKMYEREKEMNRQLIIKEQQLKDYKQKMSSHKQKIENTLKKKKELEEEIDFDEVKRYKDNMKTKQKEYDDEVKRKYGNFRNFFNEKYAQYNQQNSQNSNNQQNSQNTNNQNNTDNQNNTKNQNNANMNIELLKKYGINNKKDWKMWLVKNHPDKSPDTDQELVKSIITAGRKLGY